MSDRSSTPSQVLRQAPCAALRPFVKHLLVVEASAAHADIHLPDTGLVAAFRFRGSCQMYGEQTAPFAAPRAAITGLWNQARRHAHSQDHAVVIAAFTNSGAAALIRQPLETFANHSADLGETLEQTNDVRELCERLASATEHSQRLHWVEQFLLARVDPTRIDPLIVQAAAHLERASAKPQIHALAREMGLSQSAFERRFRQKVGSSPRQFANIARLQRVLQLQRAGADWTYIAHQSGYYDQAHFNRDFKHIAGVAPSVYFGQTPA